MKTILYAHTGSGNHGCEALVRSTAKLLDCTPILFSTGYDEDIQFGIADIANVELDLIRYLGHGRLEMVAHIILFLFIAGKNADLDNIREKKTVEHSITK